MFRCERWRGYPSHTTFPIRPTLYKNASSFPAPFLVHVPLAPFGVALPNAGLLSSGLSLLLPQCLAVPVYQHLHLAALRLANTLPLSWQSEPSPSLVRSTNLWQPSPSQCLAPRRMGPPARSSRQRPPSSLSPLKPRIPSPPIRIPIQSLASPLPLRTSCPSFLYPNLTARARSTSQL